MKYSVVNSDGSVSHGELDYNYHPAGAVINEDETLTAEQLKQLLNLQESARSAGYTKEQIAAVTFDSVIVFPKPINLSTDQLAVLTTTQL